MKHDMSVYFDAVLDVNMTPLCNGTPEEVLAWLDERPQFHDQVQVCIGKTMEFMTVEDYLEQFG